MTSLGLRHRTAFPSDYKGFRVVQTGGRVYGIPAVLNADEIIHRGVLTTHPAVVAASSLEELWPILDGYDHDPYEQEHLGRFDGYNLFQYQGRVYALPTAAGFVDLNVPEERKRSGILTGATRADVESQIKRLHDVVPVEFAGWLPIYETAGNCGKHPQFSHANQSPAGYQFTCSAPTRTYTPQPPAWIDRIPELIHRAAHNVASRVTSLWMKLRPVIAMFRREKGSTFRARFRLMLTVLRLFLNLRRRGVAHQPALQFLRTRHYQSQLMLTDCQGLLFLTSMPFTYGQHPWVLEIEDPTTLFYPFIQNGLTSDLDIAASPYLPIVKTLLEDKACKGVVTHMKSTARLVKTLFKSDEIAAKIFYAPMGVRLPERYQRHDDDEQINLVFINSWCQVPTNFFLRGGLDILEAFATLRERYPQLRLTLRTNLPGLDGHYQKIMDDGWVRVINRFLTPQEMEDLLAESHIFLLPAARIHIVSLLQALSYGLAVVASDGWGIEEYLKHEHNGLVVKGRYGKVSWADEQAGILREDYEPMSRCDADVVQGIVDAVSRLVEDRALRKRLGRQGRSDVQNVYNLDNWNNELKRVFDQAVAVKAA